MRGRCLDQVRACGLEQWRYFETSLFFPLINYFVQIELGLGLRSFKPKFSNISC